MSTTATSAAHATTTGQDALALAGRALIALLFVPAGWSKIGGFAGTAGYIASKGLPLPEVAAAIAIAVELGLGLMLLVGWRTRWAALGLAVFTVFATFVFHNYWAMPAEQVMMQRQAFFKNLAITGGLLAFMAFGAGGWSLDARTRRR
ncbi:DoxX family protein [Ramlibacter sp. AN1015]